MTNLILKSDGLIYASIVISGTISEAVVCDDQKEARKILEALPIMHLNTPHPVPGLEFDIEDKFTHCTLHEKHYHKVAILKPTVVETEVDEQWISMLAVVDELRQDFNDDYVIKQIKQHYTITKKQ